MLKRIDQLSDAAGLLAAWFFVVIGAMICYEVIARYVFLSPTIWAEELSRLVQIWAGYLAAAYVLRHRHMIRITAITDRLGPRGRRVAESFSLIWIIIFCGYAIWWGLEIAIDSIIVGRADSTMLALPLWFSEFAVPVGFGLLLLQALAELARLAGGAVPPRSSGETTV